MKNNLFPQQLLLMALRFAYCLPMDVFILLLHNFGDFLAGVKSEDKWAKLKETGR